MAALRQRKPPRAAAADNGRTMARKFPLNPPHPERSCWGCDRYCAADAMICGNGTERTQHPSETFGEGWEGFGLDPVRPQRLLQPLQPMPQPEGPAPEAQP